MKGFILLTFRLHCGRCLLTQEEPMLPGRPVETVARRRGWAHTARAGWICPDCLCRRLAEINAPEED